MRHLALALLLTLSGAGAASAQAPATSNDARPGTQPDIQKDRFQLEREGEGFVRLDRHTGLASYCVARSGELSCRASADERAALQEEIDRLAARVDELEGRPAADDKAQDDRSITLKLPSEQEVNRVLGFFEDMMQRFVDMVRGLGGSGGAQRI